MAAGHGTRLGATHIVHAVTVGAFDFHTGANARVLGGANVLGAGSGASSGAERETIARDGKVDACSSAKEADSDPRG